MHRHPRMKQHNRIMVVAALVLASTAGVAKAQDVDMEMTEPPAPPRGRMAFIEAAGSYGIQFGSTPYLPAGMLGDYQHPIVHGFGVGGTAGFYVVPDTVALIANYEFSRAQSREGSITGILDEVQGQISYHTALVGVRLRVPVGFGALQAELAGGVVFPYQTELRYDYGAGLGQLPTPITGTGARFENYSVGVGGHGMVGYEMPLGDVFYLAVNFKLRMFESENSGESTQYQNFVTDFRALPPTATDATVTYGDGAAQPSTNSVQDARLQLAIGAGF